MQSPARQISIATTLLVVIAGGVMLYFLRSILLPFILAGLLSVLFRPIVRLLRDRKIPMVICVVMVLLITSAALFGMYLIISSGVEGAIAKGPEYEVRIDGIINDFNALARKLSFQMTGSRSAVRIENLISGQRVAELTTGVLSTMLGFIQDSVLVLLFLIFMIPAAEVFPIKLQIAFAGHTNVNVLQIYNSVSQKVIRYLSLKTVLNLVVGALTWIVLVCFGVDFAPLIALLTFLLHYLPNIGSVFSAGLPGLVVMAQYGSFSEAALIVGILVVMQNIIGNIIEPKLMGGSLDLSPVLVLFSLVFWGWMWGPMGMILSVPIMAVLKTVLEAVPTTQPIAVLMSSRPPIHVSAQPGPITPDPPSAPDTKGADA